LDGAPTRLPWLYRRYVAVYVMATGAQLDGRYQTPDADVVKEHFPNDSAASLQIATLVEFDPNGMGFNNNSWCTVVNYTPRASEKLAAIVGTIWPQDADSSEQLHQRLCPGDAANTSTANAVAATYSGRCIADACPNCPPLLRREVRIHSSSQIIFDGRN